MLIASQSPDRAEALHKESCDYGSALGCANYAALFYPHRDLAVAILYLEKACNLKDSTSCTNVGLLAQQDGNTKRAELYLGKGCVLGEGPACVSWKASAEKLCKSDGPGCLEAAGRYEDQGEVIDADFMLTVACDAGFAAACQPVH